MFKGEQQKGLECLNCGTFFNQEDPDGNYECILENGKCCECWEEFGMGWPDRAY